MYSGRRNKFDKHLSRLPKKKDKGQINKITNERENIRTYTTEIQKIIKLYYK